jgi:hypothetical protein
MDKDELLFQSLTAMLHSAAMQGLGKTLNPVSGKIERDLGQARIYIDILEVIRTKTKGNLAENEKKFLDQLITECQLNYVDEINKDAKIAPETQDGEKSKETPTQEL